MPDFHEAEDHIRIEELEVFSRVGVPDEERAHPQRLTVSLVLWPEKNFGALGDDLGKTINYAAVCEEVKGFAASRAVKLIETLANELASHLLVRFRLRRLRVEIRKFILPDTRHVAVCLTREQLP